MSSSTKSVITKDEFEDHKNVLAESFNQVHQAIAQNTQAITRNTYAIEKNAQAIATLSRNLNSFRSETIGRFADVMGELKLIREELTILPHQVRRNSNRLDVVEGELGIATQL